METKKIASKPSLDCITLHQFLPSKPHLNQETSIKKIGANEYQKRKSTFKLITSTRFPEKSLSNLDFIKERTSTVNKNEHSDDQKPLSHLLITPDHNQRPKGVRFRDRISIESLGKVEMEMQKILIDISNEQKISMLHNIVKNKNFSLPMTSRCRAPQNVKIASDLMNAPVQSNNSVVQELKCFMCHYPQQNSVLFGRRVISQAKQRLQSMSDLSASEGAFFRYEAFGYFLKALNDLNYDSLQVITAYETVLNKYTYPTAIKLMLYYTGSFLYQLNNLYDKSEEILNKLCDELLKLELYEYMGVYLILMVKQKANLLEWDLSSRYLMKLLAYAWLHMLKNLEVWVYFELARSFFFMNQHDVSEYFQTRSEMSIIEPTTNIYRGLMATEFSQQIISMRRENKPFNLDRQISTCEMLKLPSQPTHETKERDDLKLQAQIKSINEYCKIRHVKNLLWRMNSSQDAHTSQKISNQKTYSMSKCNTQFAGNPLLRTHESGLKNLKVYFRNNPKGQSLLNKNRQLKLYTFENSNKNILVVKELCRNILLEMKLYLPININQN